MATPRVVVYVLKYVGCWFSQKYSRLLAKSILVQSVDMMVLHGNLYIVSHVSVQVKQQFNEGGTSVLHKTKSWFTL